MKTVKKTFPSFFNVRNINIKKSTLNMLLRSYFDKKKKEIIKRLIEIPAWFNVWIQKTIKGLHTIKIVDNIDVILEKLKLIKDL